MNIAIIFSGILAGILSGFLGIGGGVIMIPALIYVCGFSQRLAQGTTLAAMIPPIGLLAAIVYWKAGNVNVKAAVLMAIGFIFGGLFGGIIAQYIPENLLRKSFAIFLVLVAVKMWLQK
jgi:hypothetical protein